MVKAVDAWMQFYYLLFSRLATSPFYHREYNNRHRTTAKAAMKAEAPKPATAPAATGEAPKPITTPVAKSESKDKPLTVVRGDGKQVKVSLPMKDDDKK